MRLVALKNLNESKLWDLSTAYHTHKKDSGYGENANKVVENYLYSPAINSKPTTYDLESGEESDLIKDSLLNSRKEGERYSGQVSEHDIIKTSANIMQQSLSAVKVNDIMSFLGFDTSNIQEKYKGKYITDLAQSENEEDKKIALSLISGYIQYQTTQRVSLALGQGAESLKGGLEKLVMKEE